MPKPLTYAGEDAQLFGTGVGQDAVNENTVQRVCVQAHRLQKFLHVRTILSKTSLSALTYFRCVEGEISGEFLPLYQRRRR